MVKRSARIRKIAAFLTIFVFVLLSFYSCKWLLEGRKLVSLEIDKSKTKTQYHMGDEPDIVLILNFSDKSTETVTARREWISGFNSGTPGVKNVTVTFGGKSVTFEVTIDSAALTGITITKLPAKTVYFVEEALDLSGLEVKAV